MVGEVVDSSAAGGLFDPTADLRHAHALAPRSWALACRATRAGHVRFYKGTLRARHRCSGPHTPSDLGFPARMHLRILRVGDQGQAVPDLGLFEKVLVGGGPW